MSRVDVVIPCYKYAHFLNKCVDSVLRQRGVDVRVLVIDDCSPDDTPKVARDIVSRDARVEYRRHTTNRGHIATYNEGLLEWVRSEYCMLLSADDMLLPGALCRATSLMDARPDVAFVYGREVRDEREVPGDYDATRPANSSVLPGAEFVERSCVKGGNLVSTPTVVVRTSVQQKVGGYRPEFPHAGDMEMWLRCAAHGAVGFTDAPQAFYRVHGTNMSTAYYATKLADLRQQSAVFDRFFSEYGYLYPAADELLRTARRRIAESAFWGAHTLFDRGETELCRECLQFALSLDPGVRGSLKWWRLALKRAVGPRVWSALQPSLARLRGASRATSAPLTESLRSSLSSSGH